MNQKPFPLRRQVGLLALATALSVTLLTATHAAQPSASPIPKPQAQPSPSPSPVSQKVESQGPSFDCSKASTAVERAICGDQKLAELDVEMANAYNAALSKLLNKQDARNEQGLWMRKVRDACTSVQCLVDAYQRRLETFSPSLKGAAVFAVPNRKPNEATDSAAIPPPAEETKAAPLMPAATVAAGGTPAASSTPLDRTLIGTMKWGKSDSCLEVQSGQKTKCYGFAAQGAVETSLLVMGACLQGDKCNITGAFDDDKELILSVAGATASPRDVAISAAEQQPIAPTAVSSTPPGLPTDAAASPKGFSGLGIGLGIAGIAVLLLVTVLFVRKGKGVKENVNTQAVKPESTPTAISTPTPTQLKTDLSPPAAIVPFVSDLTYQVSLNGVRTDESVGDVQRQLAALFKTTVAQVNALLAAPGYVVKKGVSLEVATKYKSAIEAAGGVCEIVPDKAALTSLDVDLPELGPSMPAARRVNS